jgi:4-diphosphocytidyl-2-C-methyl-D-erythritol kinase
MLRTITEPAYAKINLALHVLGRRADGYHELDSIVAFAKIGDVVELEMAAQTTFTVSGPFAIEVPTDRKNIAVQAYDALSKLYEKHNLVLPTVKIHLVKNLPVASGIGGGSADAAAVLRGLLKLFPADIPEAEIARCALGLGADVPVCLGQKTCRMQGVGERISYPELKLPEAIVLVNPNLALSTPDVFRNLNLNIGQSFCQSIQLENQSSWRNDLTDAALHCRPEIAEILAALEPCKVARMSGSGATCFGLCDDVNSAEALAQSISTAYPNWWVKAATLI